MADSVRVEAIRDVTECGGTRARLLLLRRLHELALFDAFPTVLSVSSTLVRRFTKFRSNKTTDDLD